MADTGITILVVDDDESLLRTMTAILGRGGYSVLAFSGAMAALRKARDFEGEIHLLLTDVNMPELDGLTLAQQLLAERSDMRVLLMSGCSVVPSVLPLIRKPFRMAQLLAGVSAVMGCPAPLNADVAADKISSGSHGRAERVAEVDKTRRRFLEVSRQFAAVTKDVPSGIPNPDGMMPIEREAKVLRKSFEEYQRARKMLDEEIATDYDR
ncbi:MAG TPA: response regulator [Bryobacteraceae bacterium]|jgi:DNA-binding NtrC family response regulator|nr:response regulator [Bryobacteraceae bacterium]